MKREFWVFSLIGILAFSCFNPPIRETSRQGEGSSESDTLPDQSQVAAGPSLFTPLRQEVGVQFRHYNAATTERRLPETMGSGVAFFDFDNDGYPDIFFVNGGPIEQGRDQRATGRLYRNLRNGQFEDVTENSGLDEVFYGMGVAVGDLENDGFLDLAVSSVDQVRIFRNLGKGRFRNVTEELGLNCPGFGTSLAFLDFDRDSFLDLFVLRYVEWSPQRDIRCSPNSVNRTYCTPEAYPKITNCLFRNVKGNKFEDISSSSGLNRFQGKALGLVTLDYNDDGWQDVAVANNTEGNFLLINQSGKTFTDIGSESGMAFSESGVARGGMGIDAGDIDEDGQVEIVIGNFSQEMNAYFHRGEGGAFIDDAAQVGIGLPTLMSLSFGVLVEDFDNDGWLDVLFVNGHIEPEIVFTQQTQSYRQPPQFFRNLGNGGFEALDANSIGLDDFLLVARGFACADFDLDGDLDFVVTQNGGPAYFLKNNQVQNNWLQISLVGTKSNRIGYGTRVKIFTPQGVITRDLTSSRSYLSASEPVISVGLGKNSIVERIELFWPSGIRQVIENPEINTRLRVIESEK